MKRFFFFLKRLHGKNSSLKRRVLNYRSLIKLRKNVRFTPIYGTSDLVYIVPLLAANEVEAWRVECAEKIEMSTPAQFSRVVLTHRPKVWAETELCGLRKVMKKESQLD